MKNFKKTMILGTLAAAALPALAVEPIVTAPDGYKLRWSDEFNGNTLNEQLWNIEVNGNGGGNQELQYYRRENVSVADGNLVLTARRENYQGRSFTSGRVNTKNNVAFKHGVLQTRVKFPRTKDGLWPAYWMMGNDMDRVGWPKCGEMDIIELGHFNGINNGTQDRYFGGTLHFGPDASNEHHYMISQDYLTPEDNPITNDDYHIITVEWDNDNIYMYYDLEGWSAAKKRQARFFSTSVKASDEITNAGHYFQKPFFFLYNLAVGGWYPDIYDPAKITALPNMGDEAKMFVDWVRVYQDESDENSQWLYYDENGEKVTNIPDTPEPPKGDDDKTELSSFATKALDENGVSTFDFDDVEDAVLISTSDGVTGNLLDRNAVKANYNVDETHHFMYIWEATYVPDGTTDRVNSFGWEEGYSRFAVASKGWSGLGFASTGEIGKDLSMIDDSYWLHFAMKGYDNELHASHSMMIGEAQFRIGNSDGKYVSLGDFKRDGEWYYFDIPVKALHEMNKELFAAKDGGAKNYMGNVIAFLSGGIEGAELSFDNIFFYKSKSKEIPTYTDTSADLGAYGYKSLDEEGKPVFDFDKAKNVTPLVLSGDMWEHLTAGGTYDNSIVKKEHDNSEQANRANFFSWDNTMVNHTVMNTPNSFGNIPYEGFVEWSSVKDKGWSGAGWAAVDGNGRTIEPMNLSHITDDYILHFSVRSEQAVAHAPYQIKIGAEGTDAYITLGKYSTNPIFGDFNRDGEWYSFDIPLKELKMYGGFWTKAGTDKASYKDYSLSISNTGVLYDGCYVALDNVFLWEPVNPEEIDMPEIPELGRYTTKSLDENGKSYFDFSNKVYWPISAGAKERELMGEENIVADLSINDDNIHLYPWEGTYVPNTDVTGTVNSFGNDENWWSWMVTGLGGWCGMGLSNDKYWEIGELGDDAYLHFALKGTQEVEQNFIIGDKVHFTIGNRPHGGGEDIYPSLGNYKKDGEWYSFDLPLKELYKINGNMFNGNKHAFKGNLMCFSTLDGNGNAVYNRLLDIDNIFFWEDKDKFEESGIEDIITEDNTEEVVLGIYNINGIRVSDMSAPGLYIIRTNKGARKVMK